MTNRPITSATMVQQEQDRNAEHRSEAEDRVVGVDPMGMAVVAVIHMAHP